MWAIPSIIAASIIVAIVVLFIVVRTKAGSRSSVVQLSHLNCRKCGAQFDYAWIPGGSLTSIRLGNSRYLRCPVCKKSSVFNIWNTKVDPKSHHCEIKVGPS
jgi:hypothetical protein